jgi:hypothetical protein
MPPRRTPIGRKLAMTAKVIGRAFNAALAAGRFGAILADPERIAPGAVDGATGPRTGVGYREPAFDPVI